MTISYFDSHAHLCHERLFSQVEELAERAKKNHVYHILNICTNLDTLEKGIALHKKYPWIYVSAATTPHDAALEGEAVFPTIAHHARQGHLHAIGETGLDYYYYRETSDIQQKLLRRYLQLALECQLPVVIHCRDAFADFFKILDEEYVVNGKHAKGVLHCFTGNLSEAKEVIARGWYLSLSGIVTFKKGGEELREIVQSIPLEQLLVETDSPYLAPQSKRSKTNEPSYLPETVAVIASAKGLTTEQVAAQTSANAFQFLQKP